MRAHQYGSLTSLVTQYCIEHLFITIRLKTFGTVETAYLMSLKHLIAAAYLGQDFGQRVASLLDAPKELFHVVWERNNLWVL